MVKRQVLNDKLNLHSQYTRRLSGHQLRSSVSPARPLKARIRQGRFGVEVRHLWSAQLACGAGHVGAVASSMVRLKTHQTGRGDLRGFDQMTQGYALRCKGENGWEWVQLLIF